ncbi:MAG: CBS domain-containing protein [Anaerolineae bacterium]|jgi:CBS domain-containing protein|nr:CBS domain-containing protein [Anaerolineae bacterium]
MFENVSVKDWMTAPVYTIKAHTPISEAHQIMKEKSVRRLPVVHGEALVGMITIGDVREASPSNATTLSIWELNYLWAQLTVEKIMTRDIKTVHPETPILDAAEMMLEYKISGLPVVDHDGKLVGIVTESDLFRMLVKSRRKEPVGS